MHVNYHNPKLPDPAQLDRIHQKADRNLKYKLIVLLMEDAGLRVTEVVRLRIRDFDCQNRMLAVSSLKKRANNKGKIRHIPMSARVLEAFAAYWYRLPDRAPDAYVFPAGPGSAKPHLDRRSVWRRIKKYSNQSVYPHMLRHHFATNIVSNGNDVRAAKALLGHQNLATTEIYLHVSEQKLRQAINSIEKKPGFLVSLKNWFAGTAPLPSAVIPVNTGLTRFHVGRKEELSRLFDLAHRKVNILILGEQGVGKSHLLDSFRLDKVIRIDEFRYPKQLLAGLLLELYDQDKNKILSLIAKTGSREDFVNKIATRESIKRLSELAMEATQPQEYAIFIDDVSNITRAGVKILETLKNHFHIIAAGRRVRMEYRTAFTNFERIELLPLPRKEAVFLIEKLSEPLAGRIEDFEAFKTRIWDDSQGNPLFICEMIDRFSREPLISVEITENIRHVAGKNEVDFTVILLICVSSLMALRYMGSEFGEDAGAFRLIGGLALVFAIFARPIFRRLKRNWL